MTFATYWYVLLGAVGGGLNAALLSTRRPEHRGEPLAVILGVAAGIYVGFGLQDGRPGQVLLQVLGAVPFIVLATRPSRTIALLGVAWLAHGLWDGLHEFGLLPTTLPSWYPAVCLGWDVVLGAAALRWAYALRRQASNGTFGLQAQYNLRGRSKGMRTHRFAEHTPDEMRHLSNLGHLIEGLVLALIAVLALVGRLTQIAWAHSAWPIVAILAGLVLLLMLYPRHPIADWPAIWRDAQQREHTIMALLILAAGLAQSLSTGGILRYVWPGSVLAVGYIFLAHKQHGQGEAVVRATLIHRILGATLILASGLAALDLISPGAVFSILWPLALLAAALQLLVYKEPEGAYDSAVPHAGHR